MASTYLTKTMTAGNSNTLKFTFSAWVKRTGLSSNDGMQFLSVADEYIYLGFFSDSLRMEIHDVDNVRLRSNAKFRDTNAWYHVVFTFDSTQATASDRMKMWVNNEQITDLDVANYPNQNYGTYIGTNTQHSLGRRENDDSDYFDGIISHAHLTVGYTYTPSAFGEYDANGVWKIKTSPSVTYGNNGFFILKDGNSVTDQSPNTNNFTVAGGTLTKTEDNPSNVFVTLNPLYKSSGTVTFSNGNSKVVGVDYSNQRTGGTLGASSGKFYFETKMTGSVSFGGSTIGIADYDNVNIANSTTWFGSDSNYLGFYGGGTLKVLNNGANNDYGTLNVNDIVGFAFDIDNGFVYISRNGTWLNSGDPTSGSTGTGNVNRSGNLNYNFAGKLMGIAGGFQSTDSPISNFGNGYFGTTAVSSAGTNASGIGIFEYDVPTGFTALSTKGLNL